MCIIVYKPKNEPIPSDDILKNCFMINSDGAGFMFSDGNNVVIRKGLMKFEDFKRCLNFYDNKYNLKDKNLVLHFRIGTSGGITKEKCHPFPLGNENTDKINDIKLRCDKALVHNGVLGSYVYGKLSDTQNYIIDYLNEILELNKDINNPHVQKLIKAELETSKLVILDKDDNAYMFGDFKKDNGIYYSNATYKTSYYTSALEPITYSSYKKNYAYNYSSYWNKQAENYETSKEDGIDFIECDDFEYSGDDYYKLKSKLKDPKQCREIDFENNEYRAFFTDSDFLLKQSTSKTYYIAYYLDKQGNLYEVYPTLNFAYNLGYCLLMDENTGKQIQFSNL